MIPSSVESYSIKRDPQMYGGNHSDYVKKSNEAIQEALKTVEQTIEEKRDLKELFFRVLDDYAKTRHQIAVSHRTKDARKFGRKRLESISNVNYTPLTDPYVEFNDKMIAFLQKVIKKGSIPIKGDSFEKKYILIEKFQDRACSFEVELLTGKELTEREWNQKTPSNIKEVDAQLKKVSGMEEKIIEESCIPTDEEKVLLEEYNQGIEAIKKEFPKFYIHKKMSYILEWLSTTFPSPKAIYKVNGDLDRLEGNKNYLKSIYILAKVRIEIDKKMYALSEYITWTFRDYRTDPVERMNGSIVVIIHQDRCLLNDTLKHIASVFEKALLWDKSKEDINTLKDRVALVRYLFAHAMPLVRGSASVGEWIEKLVYKFHGFNCKHNSKTMGDLEAFIAPMWSTFRQNYDSTFELTPIEKSSPIIQSIAG